MKSSDTPFTYTLNIVHSWYVYHSVVDLRDFIPSGDNRNPWPGLTKYLLTEEPQRKAKYNISKYNKNTRAAARSAIYYLTLFLQMQSEKEIAEVLTWPVARALVMSMLGDGSPERSRRHHKIAQQTIFRATGTLLEMLDKTHYEIVSKRLRDIQTDAFGVSSPSTEIASNPGYKQYRKQIEKDLVAVSR